MNLNIAKFKDNDQYVPAEGFSAGCVGIQGHVLNDQQTEQRISLSYTLPCSRQGSGYPCIPLFFHFLDPSTLALLNLIPWSIRLTRSLCTVETYRNQISFFFFYELKPLYQINSVAKGNGWYYLAGSALIDLIIPPDFLG